jgi:hypothetical protein
VPACTSGSQNVGVTCRPFSTRDSDVNRSGVITFESQMNTTGTTMSSTHSTELRR